MKPDPRSLQKSTDELIDIALDDPKGDPLYLNQGDIGIRRSRESAKKVRKIVGGLLIAIVLSLLWWAGLRLAESSALLSVTEAEQQLRQTFGSDTDEILLDD